MGTKDIWESAEYAANYLWFITQSKKCPKCGAPIQKVDGCNHMKCGAKGCKHEFCWICLTPWSKHGSATGGYWRCNRFQTKTEQDAETISSTAASPTATSDTNGATTAQNATSAANQPSTSASSQSASTSSPPAPVSGADLQVAESTTTSKEQSGPCRVLASGKGRTRNSVSALKTDVSKENDASNANTNPSKVQPARRASLHINDSDLKKTSNRATQDLHKFLHYYSRFFNHRLSMKLEIPLLDQVRINHTCVDGFSRNALAITLRDA